MREPAAAELRASITKQTRQQYAPMFGSTMLAFYGDSCTDTQAYWSSKNARAQKVYFG